MASQRGTSGSEVCNTTAAVMGLLCEIMASQHGTSGTVAAVMDATAALGVAVPFREPRQKANL